MLTFSNAFQGFDSATVKLDIRDPFSRRGTVSSDYSSQASHGYSEIHPSELNTEGVSTVYSRHTELEQRDTNYSGTFSLYGMHDEAPNTGLGSLKSSNSLNLGDSFMNTPGSTQINNRLSYVNDQTDSVSNQPLHYSSETFSEFYNTEYTVETDKYNNSQHPYYSVDLTSSDLFFSSSRISDNYDCPRSSLDIPNPFSFYSMNIHSSHGNSYSACESNPLTPSHDPHLQDSFLYDSPIIQAQTSLSTRPIPPLPSRTTLTSPKRTPPPLPPRSYIALADHRDAYSAVDPFCSPLRSLTTSNHSSSSSISSPHLPDYSDRRSSLPGVWSHAMPSLTSDSSEWDTIPTTSRPTSQLMATATPYLGSTQNLGGNGGDENKAGITESKKDGVGEGKENIEKKKGAGEDVDIALLRNCTETRSAVMIRNIPNRFSPEEFGEILDQFVNGKYVIINMPLDSKTKRNLGYSFIQFNSIQDLIIAYDNLQGKTWPRSESVKKCRFCYAKIQGDPNSIVEGIGNEKSDMCIDGLIEQTKNDDEVKK